MIFCDCSKVFSECVWFCSPVNKASLLKWINRLATTITCVLFSGTLSMLDCNVFPGLGQDYLTTEVNMFLLPVQENDGEDNLTKAGYKHLFFS